LKLKEKMKHVILYLLMVTKHLILSEKFVEIQMGNKVVELYF